MDRVEIYKQQRVLELVVTLAGVALAAWVGWNLAQHPILLMAVALAAGLMILTSVGPNVDNLFLMTLAFSLAGYMLQGRGFAYLGLAPIYIGEVVLAVGLASLFFSRVRWKVSTLELILIIFMLMGLMRTIPYYSNYGLDAIRDAALWYYALFALIVCSLLTRERLEKAVQIFAMALPWILVWFAIMVTMFRFLPESLPHWPGSPEPILTTTKPGDLAVALAGVAAFVLSGLFHASSARWRIPMLVFWPLWFVSAFIVAVQNRSGMLTIAIAMTAAFIMLPSRHWLRLVIIGSCLLALLLIINPNIEAGGGRSISVDQLTLNLRSIFSEDTADIGNVQDNKDWRLDWWGKIWNYTVQGDYFWTGKGFGVNLAVDDDVPREPGLRSPHSAHLTILARMGVPGLLVWITLQSVFVFSVMGALRRSRRQGAIFWSQINVWILVYWLAFMVNASFDVFLEGPQGGIWFWSMFGFGLAALRLQMEEFRSTATADPLLHPAPPHAHPSHP